MGGLPEPPRGWDPETDSLEDLVHAMFQDDPAELQRSATSDAPPTPAADGRERPAARMRPRKLLSGRGAAPLLAVAALVTAVLAGGQILTATTAAAPVAGPPTAAPSPVASPSTAAAATPQPAAPPGRPRLREALRPAGRVVAGVEQALPL